MQHLPVDVGERHALVLFDEGFGFLRITFRAADRDGGHVADFDCGKASAADNRAAPRRMSSLAPEQFLLTSEPHIGHSATN